jgi:hypothetical protein
MSDAASAPAGLSWRRVLPVLALTIAGFLLTLRIFYPGVMTYDAWYVHADIAKGEMGDWQSPVQVALWRLIEHVVPGGAGMFLFIAALYWLAFATLGLALARRSAWLGAVAPVLALAPPCFVFAGIIWRDIMLAASWLLAAALVFLVAERRDAWRRLAQAAALVLLCFGLLLRPNGVFAAPILLAYILWPDRFDLKRVALLYVPAGIAFALLTPLVYYGALHAKRQHVEHAIFVFDLAGISHFTGENQFPVTWSADENALLIGPCYRAGDWDDYWTRQPCLFVMKKLDAEKLFGAPALRQAWLQAIAAHPLAYLEHRAAVSGNFLFDRTLTMFTTDIVDPGHTLFADNAWFQALRSLHDRLYPTPLFRAGAWLALCIVWCVVGWRRRATSAGAFLLGACGSAVVYMLTFIPVGVAGDFRYALWAVLAGLAGVAVGGVRDSSPA